MCKYPDYPNMERRAKAGGKRKTAGPTYGSKRGAGGGRDSREQSDAPLIAKHVWRDATGLSLPDGNPVRVGRLIHRDNSRHYIQDTHSPKYAVDRLEL